MGKPYKYPMLKQWMFRRFDGVSVVFDVMAFSSHATAFVVRYESVPIAQFDEFDDAVLCVSRLAEGAGLS